MAEWNEYINDFYYPENTSADAPEKILYFFIRNELCSNSVDIEFTKESNKTNWNEIFKNIDFKTNNNDVLDSFKEYYLIKLQEGRKGKGILPVPFHIDIPCTFKIMSETKAMDNRGFSKKFLLAFFSKNEGINYSLIQKLWNVLSDYNELNYYEILILKRIKELGYKTVNYKLKSEEAFNVDFKRYNLHKFKCTHQTAQFQIDLDYVLDLPLARVEKIGWVNNLIYFHFSTYMMRIFYVINLEEKKFNTKKSDYCSRCNGLKECPYKSQIMVKSSLTGNNREANIVKSQYKELVNNILIKGYYRFIALNQLFKTFKEITSKYPESISEVLLLYNSNPEQFLRVLKKRLSTFDKLNEIELLKEKINSLSIENGENIFSSVFEIYKKYYEKTQAKKSSSADNATKQVYNKLAGDKMGCNYLKINRNGVNNYYCLNSDFLTFIANIIIGKGKRQMPLEGFWKQMETRGFFCSSVREKEIIEKQLSLLGHLERKSDAGESQYVEHTIF
ncbi:hypothetical protein K2F40_15090 [Clostridium sp. CM028]|uniref:hypothetical protein n=1 Tax=Clostridium sp. CM028 TaxID=2851575 RepID=UPI001C6E7D39|nr:hypothetical protein [Clostridium sp. CM028]MBW9150284.1 hypothetical protein [Clostridium sp. CM028]WLC62840.1 hypothetical protein KTC94_06185 [Clostridium sp. CM028]